MDWCDSALKDELDEEWHYEEHAEGGQAEHPEESVDVPLHTQANPDIEQHNNGVHDSDDEQQPLIDRRMCARNG